MAMGDGFGLPSVSTQLISALGSYLLRPVSHQMCSLGPSVLSGVGHSTARRRCSLFSCETLRVIEDAKHKTVARPRREGVGTWKGAGDMEGVEGRGGEGAGGGRGFLSWREPPNHEFEEGKRLTAPLRHSPLLSRRPSVSPLMQPSYRSSSGSLWTRQEVPTDRSTAEWREERTGGMREVIIRLARRQPIALESITIQSRQVLHHSIDRSLGLIDELLKESDQGRRIDIAIVIINTDTETFQRSFEARDILGAIVDRLISYFLCQSHSRERSSSEFFFCVIIIFFVGQFVRERSHLVHFCSSCFEAVLCCCCCLMGFVVFRCCLLYLVEAFSVHGLLKTSCLVIENS